MRHNANPEIQGQEIEDEEKEIATAHIPAGTVYSF